jgi:D-glycero-D-manno-heptose 1,7-bisphosphate phosphatase
VAGVAELPKLIILDRDGVINEDSNAHIKSPSEWKPIPGALEAIADLQAAGWLVAVATNQSGLARGLFTTTTLRAIHDKLQDHLARRGACIDLIVWCPHGPEDQCDCRKPASGLYQQIAKHFNCSLMQVPVVGDSKRDLEAAVKVGARPILVLTGKGQATLSEGDLPPQTEVHPDLREAVDALLANHKSPQRKI